MTTRNLSRYHHARTLDSLYPMPRPMATIEEYQRAHHLDLPSLDTEDLKTELRCVARRLDYERDPQEWLRERRDALRRELKLRQAQQKNRPSTPAAITWGPSKPATDDEEAGSWL